MTILQRMCLVALLASTAALVAPDSNPPLISLIAFLILSILFIVADAYEDPK